MKQHQMVLIVRLAHQYMEGWNSLHSLYLTYIRQYEPIDVLDLIEADLAEYEKKLFSMGWKMIEPGQWMYFGEYRVQVAMTEAGLGLPVSEVANG
jgi:hypothetical protein